MPFQVPLVIPAGSYDLADSGCRSSDAPNRFASFSELHQPWPIVIDPVVLVVSPKLAIERRPDLCRSESSDDGVNQSFMALVFRSQFLLRRFPLEFELARAAMSAVMGEAKKVERARARVFIAAFGDRARQSGQTEAISSCPRLTLTSIGPIVS